MSNLFSILLFSVFCIESSENCKSSPVQTFVPECSGSYRILQPGLAEELLLCTIAGAECWNCSCHTGGSQALFPGISNL